MKNRLMGFALVLILAVLFIGCDLGIANDPEVRAVLTSDKVPVEAVASEDAPAVVAAQATPAIDVVEIPATTTTYSVEVSDTPANVSTFSVEIIDAPVTVATFSVEFIIDGE